jgi:hypothetical protein
LFDRARSPENPDFLQVTSERRLHRSDSDEATLAMKGGAFRILLAPMGIPLFIREKLI